MKLNQSYRTQLLSLLTVLALTMSGNPQAKELTFEPHDQNNLPSAVENSTHDRISELSTEITSIRESISEIDRQIEFSTYEDELDSLRNQKENQQTLLADKLIAFEQIATGIVDHSVFNETQSNDFSWHKELKEIFKPIVYELKKLTERPRQIDRLSSEIESLKLQQELAVSAINKLHELKSLPNDPEIHDNLNNLEIQWQNKLSDINSKLALVSIQLQEKQQNSGPHSGEIVQFLKDFFSGRGLNLLLATLAFSLTLITLRFLSHQLERFIRRGSDRERRFFSRLVHVVFQVLAVLLALFSLLATLYTLGDWLLLTLVIIFLISLAIALRNSLPQYLGEVRLLLNLGPVREGERIMYNGLPWRVSRLNIHSDLVNPALTGGRIRLPITELSEMVSRRWSRTEPWFPCKPKDFVILNDETYGEILLQTPDTVQLKVFGGSVKTYKTQEFLDLSPRNISEGFGISVVLKLDHSLQPEITSGVIEKLREQIKQSLDSSAYKEHIHQLNIEFDQANILSLDVVIQATVSGECASDYNNIRRFIQKGAIECCDRNGWAISKTNNVLQI